MIGPVVVAVLTAVVGVAAVVDLPDAMLAGRMRSRLGVDRTRSIGLGRPDVMVREVRARRVRRLADRRVPELLDAVVRQLRTGATIRHAIERVGADSVDPDARRLADDLRTGRSLRSSVGRWRTETSEPNHRLAAVAIDLAAVSGGASARVLDGVAETLRDRVALDREVAALSTQARASAAVLVVAPIGFALLAISIDPRLVDVLLSPIGAVCLVVGLLLDAVGAMWMLRLVGRRR